MSPNAAPDGMGKNPDLQKLHKLYMAQGAEKNDQAYDEVQKHIETYLVYLETRKELAAQKERVAALAKRPLEANGPKTIQDIPNWTSLRFTDAENPGFTFYGAKLGDGTHVLMYEKNGSSGFYKGNAEDLVAGSSLRNAEGQPYFRFGTEFKTGTQEEIKRLSEQGSGRVDVNKEISRFHWRVMELENHYSEVEALIAKLEEEVKIPEGERLTVVLKREAMEKLKAKLAEQTDTGKKLQTIHIDAYNDPFVGMKERAYHLLRVPQDATAVFVKKTLDEWEEVQEPTAKMETIMVSGGYKYLKVQPTFTRDIVDVKDMKLQVTIDGQKQMGAIEKSNDKLNYLLFTFPPKVEPEPSIKLPDNWVPDELFDIDKLIPPAKFPEPGEVPLVVPQPPISIEELADLSKVPLPPPTGPGSPVPLLPVEPIPPVDDEWKLPDNWEPDEPIEIPLPRLKKKDRTLEIQTPEPPISIEELADLSKVPLPPPTGPGSPIPFVETIPQPEQKPIERLNEAPQLVFNDALFEQWKRRADANDILYKSIETDPENILKHLELQLSKAREEKAELQLAIEAANEDAKRVPEEMLRFAEKRIAALNTKVLTDDLKNLEEGFSKDALLNDDDYYRATRQNFENQISVTLVLQKAEQELKKTKEYCLLYPESAVFELRKEKLEKNWLPALQKKLESLQPEEQAKQIEAFEKDMKATDEWVRDARHGSASLIDVDRAITTIGNEIDWLNDRPFLSKKFPDRLGELNEVIKELNGKLKYLEQTEVDHTALADVTDTKLKELLTPASTRAQLQEALNTLFYERQALEKHTAGLAPSQQYFADRFLERAILVKRKIGELEEEQRAMKTLEDMSRLTDEAIARAFADNWKKEDVTNALQLLRDERATYQQRLERTPYKDAYATLFDGRMKTLEEKESQLKSRERTEKLSEEPVNIEAEVENYRTKARYTDKVVDTAIQLANAGLFRHLHDALLQVEKEEREWHAKAEGNPVLKQRLLEAFPKRLEDLQRHKARLRIPEPLSEKPDRVDIQKAFEAHRTLGKLVDEEVSAVLEKAKTVEVPRKEVDGALRAVQGELNTSRDALKGTADPEFVEAFQKAFGERMKTLEANEKRLQYLLEIHTEKEAMAKAETAFASREKLEHLDDLTQLLKQFLADSAAVKTKTEAYAKDLLTPTRLLTQLSTRSADLDGKVSGMRELLQQRFQAEIKKQDAVLQSMRDIKLLYDTSGDRPYKITEQGKAALAQVQAGLTQIEHLLPFYPQAQEQEFLLKRREELHQLLRQEKLFRLKAEELLEPEVAPDGFEYQAIGTSVFAQKKGEQQLYAVQKPGHALEKLSPEGAKEELRKAFTEAKEQRDPLYHYLGDVKLLYQTQKPKPWTRSKDGERAFQHLTTELRQMQRLLAFYPTEQEREFLYMRREELMHLVRTEKLYRLKSTGNINAEQAPDGFMYASVGDKLYAYKKGEEKVYDVVFVHNAAKETKYNWQKGESKLKEVSPDEAKKLLPELKKKEE